MRTQLQLQYPKLQHIHQLYQKAAQALELHQTENVLKYSNAFKQLLIEAFQNQDEELFACIIHHAMCFAEVAVQKGAFDKIGVMFQLDGEQCLDVVKMIQAGHWPLVTQLLLNRFNYAKHSLSLNKDKIQILPFRQGVLGRLEQHGLPIAPEHLKMLQPGHLEEQLMHAIKNVDFDALKYIAKSMQCALEAYFLQGNVKEYALLVRQITSIITKLGDSAQSLFQHAVLDEDDELAKIVLDILKQNDGGIIDWALTYVFEISAKSHELYGMPFEVLKQQRQAIVQELLGLHAQLGKPKMTLVDNFDASLEKLTLMLQKPDIELSNVITAASQCFVALYQDIADNQPERAATHIKAIVRILVEQASSAKLGWVAQLFDIDLNEMIALLGISKTKLTGYLAWMFMTHGIELHDVAFNSGMNYDQYKQFKQAVLQAFKPEFKSVLPTPQECMESLVHVMNSPHSAQTRVAKNVNQMQFEMLIQEAYLNNDVTQMVALIKEMANTLCAVSHPESQMHVIALFELDVDDSEELFSAIHEKDLKAVEKKLTDLAMHICHEMGLLQQKAQVESIDNTTLFVRERYPFEDWCRENNLEQYALPVRDFQIQVYKQLGLETKPEDLGTYLNRYHWEWTDTYCRIDEFKQTLPEYMASVFDVLKEGDIKKIKAKKIERRQLFDFAVHQNDLKLFQELLLQDVACLQFAWMGGLQANLMSLMALNHEDIEKFNTLFESGASVSELRFAVLDQLDLSYTSFALDSQSAKGKAWEMKKQACESLAKLDKFGCGAEKFPVLFKKYQFALAHQKLVAWSELDARFGLLFNENIYHFSKNPIIGTRQFAGQLKLLIDEAMVAYEKNPMGLSIQPICYLTGLDSMLVRTLLKKKQGQLLAWYVLNNEIFQKFMNPNKLSLKKANQMKDDISVQLAQLMSPPSETLDLMALASGECHTSSVGLLRQPEMIVELAHQVAAKKDMDTLQIIGAEFHAICIDSMLRGDVERFSHTILQLADLAMDLFTKEQTAACMLLLKGPNDIDRDIESILLALQQKDDVLLRHAILEQLSLRYQAAFYGMHEEVNAFIKEVVESNQPNILIPNDRLAKRASELVEHPTSPEAVECFSRLIDFHLSHAYRMNEPEAFAEILKICSAQIRHAYATGQLGLILKSLNPTKKNIDKLMLMLESQHEKGLQDWLLEHYIVESKTSLSMIYAYVQEKPFKQEVHKALDIEAFDLILLGKEGISHNLDYKELWESIRRMANQGVDLLKHQSTVNLVAKIPAFNALLKDFQPQASDHVCYHRFYQMVQAIWHCHKAGHVFGMLKPCIQLNDFESKWEGSIDNTMIDYMLESHQKLASDPAYQEKIAKIYQRYFSKMEGLDAVKLNDALNQTLNAGLLTNTNLSTFDIQHQLASNEVVAIPVHLLEPGENVGHLVSAVFFDNKVMISDRGKEGFTGMKFFDIGCPLQKKYVIEALAKTNDQSISSTVYQGLIDSLKLKACDEIYMQGQLMGNCGLASSAEPIHLAMLYFKLYDFARKSGRCDEDAMSLANYTAEVLHEEIKKGMQLGCVETLLDFFEEPSCQIQAPRELLAHIHQIALFKLKHMGIMNCLNKRTAPTIKDKETGQVISINHRTGMTPEDTERAREEISLMIQGTLESNMTKSSRALMSAHEIAFEAKQLLELYLHDNVDTSDLIRALRLSIGKLTKDTSEGMLLLFSNSGLRSLTEAMMPTDLQNSAFDNMQRDLLEDQMLRDLKKPSTE